MPPADEPQNPEYPEGEEETLRLLRDALTNGRPMTITEELKHVLMPPLVPMVRESTIRSMREGRRGPTITGSRYRELVDERRVERRLELIRAAYPEEARAMVLRARSNAGRVSGRSRKEKTKVLRELVIRLWQESTLPENERAKWIAAQLDISLNRAPSRRWVERVIKEEGLRVLVQPPK